MFENKPQQTVTKQMFAKQFWHHFLVVLSLGIHQKVIEQDEEEEEDKDEEEERDENK